MFKHPDRPFSWWVMMVTWGIAGLLACGGVALVAGALV